MKNNPHICVDLDGTLAEYDPERSIWEVGPPVPEMMYRVRHWLSQGIEVRIFTARACYPPYIPIIEKWLEENGLGGLKVTNEKTFGMIQLWDDRAIQVIENTGVPVIPDAEKHVAELRSPKDQVGMQEILSASNGTNTGQE